MFAQLLGPITGIVGSLVQGKMEQKAAETKAKVAKAEAQAQIMVSQATSEADWEKIMAEGSQESWKDEWLTILFSVPLILAFCGEWGRVIVTDGFSALNQMPDYYRYTLGAIVSASFGIRGATKFFGKK
jgi:hypothetical protein|tara:strand:+ start:714 stop:1100 length:387 start_codon:yes stop_codon:yes gene_type:complete